MCLQITKFLFLHLHCSQVLLLGVLTVFHRRFQLLILQGVDVAHVGLEVVKVDTLLPCQRSDTTEHHLSLLIFELLSLIQVHRPDLFHLS